MAIPGDANDVWTAIRLGWCMSEVRGRNRPGWEPGASGPEVATPPAPGNGAADTYEWGASPLPLENELDLAQSREEAQKLLGKLASCLSVNNGAENDPGSFSARVERQAGALATAQPGDVVQQWEALAKLIQDFDWNVQSILSQGSTTVAAGYQLGRALADPYWALEPSLDDPANHASWLFLFSSKRSSETERLLGRLSAYFDLYTTPAIAASVQIWENVAKSREWRTEAYPQLYNQIRHWYELVVLKQDPTTLTKPYQLLKNYRLVLRTLRGFWFQLLLAALAAAAVGVFAWLLTKPQVHSWVKALLATVGLAGFSVAGLAAKVKNEAQNMLTRLKQDAYTDLITEAIITAPDPPRTVKPQRTGLIPPLTKRAKMSSIMGARSITTVTPS